MRFPHVHIGPIDPKRPMITGNILVSIDGIEFPTTYFKVEGNMDEPVQITLTFWADVDLDTKSASVNVDG